MERLGAHLGAEPFLRLLKSCKKERSNHCVSYRFAACGLVAFYKLAAGILAFFGKLLDGAIAICYNEDADGIRIGKNVNGTWSICGRRI